MTSYCKALWGQNDSQRRTTDRCLRSLCEGCRWCYIFWLLLVPVVIAAVVVVVVLLSAARFLVERVEFDKVPT